MHGHLWCVNGVIFANSESPYCWNLSIKFLIKRIYGSEEDVGWRIPRWLFTAWPSLMWDWDDMLFLSSHYGRSLPQDFAQENTWFGRRCWLKNSKMAVKCMAIFDVWMGWFLLFLSLHYAVSLPWSFCSRGYMVWKKMLVEEFQDGC